MLTEKIMLIYMYLLFTYYFEQNKLTNVLIK